MKTSARSRSSIYIKARTTLLRANMTSDDREQLDALVAVFSPPAKVYESDNDLEFRPGYPSHWKRSKEVLDLENLETIETVE